MTSTSSTNPFEYNSVFGDEHPLPYTPPNPNWIGFSKDSMLGGYARTWDKAAQAKAQTKLYNRISGSADERRGENLERKRQEWKSLQRASERELADRNEASAKMAAWLEAEAERPLTPITELPDKKTTENLAKYRALTLQRKTRGLGKNNKRFVSEWTRAWRSVRQHYAGLKAQGIFTD